MKTTILFFIAVYFIIGSSITSNAQPGNNDAFYMGCGTPVFFEAEVMPAPAGGTEKLLKDLNATVKLQKHEKGDFTVDIQMNCKGQTRNIQILNDGFDANRKEVIVTFFRGLEFYPAKQRGRAVNCNFHYLVTYKRGTFTEAKIQVPKH
jgi:hypothetical protein